MATEPALCPMDVPLSHSCQHLAHPDATHLMAMSEGDWCATVIAGHLHDPAPA